MSREDKDRAINNFQNTDISCMLLQIKCGGTGINLQAASRVYLTSPNYNPCVDLQAIGRAHRKGQLNKVWDLWCVFLSVHGLSLFRLRCSFLST
jgi:SNF2 family DNA or RNA helicase